MHLLAFAYMILLLLACLCLHLLTVACFACFCMHLLVYACICLHVFACFCMHLPAFACMCLHLRAFASLLLPHFLTFACICLLLLAFACFCLHLIVFACLCLILLAFEAAKGSQGEPKREPWGLPWDLLGGSLAKEDFAGFSKQNEQISWSIRRKLKRPPSKLERQHHFFWKSLKTNGFLMILRVREPRAAGIRKPTLENARTP